jgi:CRISPR-associated protein Cmr2
MNDDMARNLLTIFPHDPPDKALDIRGHEQRARWYLSVVLGEDIGRQEAKFQAQLPDQLAAIIERVPMPTPGADYSRAIGPQEGGRFIINHPLSAARRELNAGLVDESRMIGVLQNLLHDGDTLEKCFLTLWRHLPDAVAQEFNEDWRHLPADTRLPDHTLWHHLDIATGIASALSQPTGGMAFLSFTLGPVQSFIAAARSLRDLWSGSFLLSWLAFQAMTPILEMYGPTAFVFPSLRGNVLLDLWLQERQVDVPSTDPGAVPGLPNRFLALVPYGHDGETGRQMGERCEQAARDAWTRLAENVRGFLDAELGEAFPGWDERWSEQIATLPEISWIVVPERSLSDAECESLVGKNFTAAWPESAAIRGMAQALPAQDRPGYAQDQAGRWQAQIETVGRMAEAARLCRPVPVMPPRAGGHPLKCTILGTFDQMGPADLAESRRFWQQAATFSKEGVRVREGERLCAISLVKRFAALFFPDSLRADRFGDTATRAARIWLDRANINPDEFSNWNGQWLHGEQTPEEVDQRVAEARRTGNMPEPPSYYAILLADGDNMGDWLAGRKAPTLREVMHQTLVSYYDGLGKAGRAGLDARRPVGPGLHAAISAALHHFATIRVPRIVERAQGALVYAGGDDVLALVPVETALTCALALRAAFSEDACMGSEASLSMGMAVVHYKEDLRAALDAARKAEKRAKDKGRNRLGLQIMRRSGEHAESTMPWEVVGHLDALRQAFVNDSDRWAYRLRAEAPTLDGLVPAAIEAEFRRLLARAEISPPTRKTAIALFDYAQASSEEPLAETVAILAQSASFLARGHDR